MDSTGNRNDSDFSSMTSVYISGPMSGLPGFNRENFNAAARLLARHGFAHFNPADTPESIAGASWDLCMLACLRALLSGRYEGLVQLEGWELSEGAKLEYQIASKVMRMEVVDWTIMRRHLKKVEEET